MDPTLARQLSQSGGRFFSISWNINSVTRIVQAIDGKLMADFEPMFPPRRSDEYGYPACARTGCSLSVHCARACWRR
jgi:hypothetical protein